MADNLRIQVYPADKGGCGRYRLIHAALHLQEQGHNIQILDPDKPMDIQVMVDASENVVDVQAPDCDVIVLQRITSKPHVQAIDLLRARGYTVVMDVDDDLTCIHPSNKAFQVLQPGSGKRMGWHYNTMAADKVTMMTVSTRSLLGVYAKHGRGIVLDNYIPARYLELHHVDQDRYGWPGSLESHPDDLLVVGSAAQQLHADGYPFVQVGPYQEEVGRQLRLTEMRATGGQPLRLWAATISTLGVGWAPLSDTRFNQSKSRLKPLEMNAVGVPYVASPRAEYARMTAEGGAGLLANKPRDWYRQTKRLLTDHSLRRDMSAQAREYAATQTVEEHSWRWLEAWQHAYDLQNGKLTVKTIIDTRPGRVVAKVG